MQLPKDFLNKMKTLLKDDYSYFISSYQTHRTYGLRANSLKISAHELKENLPFLQEHIPWCPDGFYYQEKHRPAKNPLYYAGLYYIQEPSAMYPAELLDIEKGDYVLDLCAAPGGKSVQLASKLGNKGLLIVNDINHNRAKVLLKNIEKYGIKNAIVLNDTPEKIADVFRKFFDRVLVDAPCSGEGMFRKDLDMAKNWSEAEVYKYSQWQREIISLVPHCLVKGGSIVYSTCTFSIEENEHQITQLLTHNPSFHQVTSKRLWPHKVRGEGHFASLIKDTSPKIKSQLNEFRCSKILLSKFTTEALESFCLDIWNNKDYYKKLLPPNGSLVERAGHILWEHDSVPSLKGIKVLRSGWLLGTVDRGRFIPSQALAMGLSKEDTAMATQLVNYNAASADDLNLAQRYLKGETIQLANVKWAKGWYLVAIDNYPLGWGKSAQFTLKNQYPPGWRWVDGE